MAIKDLTSTPADIAVTLNGISHIVTPDLGRDLAPELIKMLNHSRPYIRKRAVAALYKTMSKYPDIVPQGVSRLEERLEDSDPSVFNNILTLQLLDVPAQVLLPPLLTYYANLQGVTLKTISLWLQHFSIS